MGYYYHNNNNNNNNNSKYHVSYIYIYIYIFMYLFVYFSRGAMGLEEAAAAAAGTPLVRAPRRLREPGSNSHIHVRIIYSYIPLFELHMLELSTFGYIPLFELSIPTFMASAMCLLIIYI